MPRPSVKNAKNIQARLSLDPRSLAEHTTALKQLAVAVRLEVVAKALLAGGGLIRSAANAKAPGPHIEMEIMSGAELSKKWRSAGAQGINPDGIYVAIGPDEKHWWYRFSEYGVKSHGVRKRKRTRKEINLRIQQGRSARTKLKRQFAGKRPAMLFGIDGKLIFTRKVRGFPAKPFLRPAADSQGNAAIQQVGAVLKTEIEKAARA